MKISTLHVALPENWFEVPDSQPREFRSLDEDSGRLQVSLNPPLDEAAASDLLAALRAALAGATELGEEQAGALEDFPIGPAATLLFKSPRVGLFQAWLLSGPEVSVFATYTMGSLPRASYELRECVNILRGLRFVSTLDTFEAYSPPPEPPRPWWRLW